MEINNDYLAHYGILGMKWGIRRSRSSSSGRSKKNHYISKDAKKAANLKKKKLSQLSNKELQTLNKRQELENKYRQNNKSKIEKGLAIATATAAAMGTVATLYNNGSKIIEIGKKVSKSSSINVSKIRDLVDATIAKRRGLL